MCRILIVDNEKPFCRLLERALRCRGLEIITTHDSRCAAGLLRSAKPFDLLITDLDMPGWSGADLARLADGLQPAPQVLFITARVKLIKQQPDLAGRHCLLKPFYLNDLRAKVALLTDCWHILPAEQPFPSCLPEQIRANIGGNVSY